MASKINKNKIIASAQKFVQKGHFDKAIKEYSKIVEEDPRDVRIWLKIGDLYAKKNDRAEAVDTYSKVAEFYSEQGFYLKAVAVYKQILKIDNSLVEMNLRLAELYKQLGLLSDAMQQYELVSNFYHQAGRTREALAALRQLVDLDPENMASRIKLAELYSKEEMKNEAIEEFSKAADFLRADNRIDDFVKVAERLVFHQPENPTLVRELASIYLRKRDPRRALQKLQLSFKSDPRDDETLEMLAQAFEDLGQLPKTISVLKELAIIHEENGQEAKRRQILERILSLDPANTEARQALEGGSAAEELDEDQATATNAAQVSEHLGGQEEGYYQPQDSHSYGDSAANYNYEEPYDQDQSFSDPATYSHREKPGQGGYREGVGYGDEQANYQAPEHLEEVSASQFEEYGIEQMSASNPSIIRTKLDPGGLAPEHLPASFLGVSEDVAKILTEAEVYIKYGLHEKAVNHLKQIFSQDPNNLEAHLKLKDLYAQLGKLQESALEAVFLGRAYLESDRSVAVEYFYQALELDADNREAQSLLASLEGQEQSTEGAYTDGSYSGGDTYGDDDTYGTGDGYGDIEPIDLDVEDIVEEIPVESSDILGTEPSTHVRDSWPEAVQDDADYIDDYSTNRSGVLPVPGLDHDRPSIELQGETTDTLGGGTPSSEIIELGVDHSPSASRIKAHQAEEASAIEDDLEEAEFFIQQNLFGEARSILEDLIERFPNHSLVQAKLADLDAQKDQISVVGGVAFDDDKDDEVTSNLATELAAEFDELESADLTPEVEDTHNINDVFDDFKRGIHSQVSDEDSDTHYDLGIAYREMGLMDDAIAEFKVAMRSREKEVLCHMMIGLCYMEKELFSESISQFKTGLYVEGISERETIALYFELGQAYERLEDSREALYYYEKVAKKDTRFRDVASRVERLSDPLEDDDPHALDGKKKKFELMDEDLQAH